ncbi:hypothetical protein [Streptomyces sp. NRRL B-24484]|uniref:hypothetical protein n=1 Tax=Streptomyces sp. NRRL B-24484 TaxID=1463833 RepID=UPI001331B706|nr:hypothetical protein [Streptomyces sp. NRRL B-24484]
MAAEPTTPPADLDRTVVDPADPDSAVPDPGLLDSAALDRVDRSVSVRPSLAALAADERTRELGRALAGGESGEVPVSEFLSAI